MRSVSIRVGMNVALAASIVLLPWWVAAAVALVFVFRFRAYEVVLWGAVADALYGVPAAFGVPMLYTLGATALFAAAEYGKRFLVFY